MNAFASSSARRFHKTQYHTPLIAQQDAELQQLITNYNYNAGSIGPLTGSIVVLLDLSIFAIICRYVVFFNIVHEFAIGLAL